MATDMDEAINATLGVEGRWSDHPSDPGGKTMFGITEGTLRRANKLGVTTHKDIQTLPVITARKIYEVMYWRPIKGDELPKGLNALVFDIQVNSGQGGRRLQNALNALFKARLAADNAIGAKTLSAVLRAVNEDPENIYRIMTEISSQRSFHWQRLSTWNVFRRGWTRRGQRILIHATRMATGNI